MLLSFRPNIVATIGLAISLWGMLAVPYVAAPTFVQIAVSLRGVPCPRSQDATNVTVCFGSVRLDEATDLEAVLRPELESKKAYGPGDIKAIIAALEAVFRAKEPMTRARMREALLRQGVPDWRARYIAGEFRVAQ